MTLTVKARRQEVQASRVSTCVSAYSIQTATRSRYHSLWKCACHYTLAVRSFVINR